MEAIPPQLRNLQEVSMFPATLFQSPAPGPGIGRYLGPGEQVIYSTQRHSVVLGSAAAVWLIAVALGLATGLTFQANGGSHLSAVGAGVILAGSAFFGLAVWRWRVARYVLTNDRIVLVEGVLSRRVNGLLLRSILDTTYHRTLLGRLFGYGDLELNLSGQPGLRTLTSLPRPDTLYHLILQMTSVRDAGVPPAAYPCLWVASFPPGLSPSPAGPPAPGPRNVPALSDLPGQGQIPAPTH